MLFYILNMFSSLLTLLIYTLLRVTLSFLAPITAQTSVPSDSMDIKGWRNSGKRAIHLGRCHHEIDHVHSLSATVAPKLRWKLLWMKIKKEKRRLFQSASFQVPYDQHTYSQNFDQGTALDEPDNLSRSFSVRFADPSIVLLTRKG